MPIALLGNVTILSAKPLAGEVIEIQALQKVLEAAPEYSYRTSGGLPMGAEAHGLFSALPPNKTYEDKFVLGFYVEDQMIGCADLVRGYPRPETAMIGLLLLSEKYQAKGLGKKAYRKIEQFCLAWPEIHVARVGVVETNASVLPFWRKRGFKETGEMKPFSHGAIQCNTIVLEKQIRSALQ